MKFELINKLFAVSLCLILVACGSNNSALPPDNLISPPSDSGSTTGSAKVTKLAVLDVAGTTERISTDTAGMQGDQNSINSSISADGQIVVFDSTSSNLVSNDTNATWDIYAKNRRDNTTRLISVASGGGQADGPSIDPKVTPDGRYVVFSSDATNLVANDLNAVSDIFLHDSLTGITTLISKNDANENGNGVSETPNVSADGRYIVFVSESTNLSLADNNSVKDIYLHDRSNATTVLVSSNSLGELGNGESINPDISADGNHVVFASFASNLVAADGNNNMDVFLKVISTKAVTRISTSSTGIEANGLSDTPSISSDGNVVAYRSTATNITNNVIPEISKQIYVKELSSGINELVSINNLGQVSNAGSFFSIGISANGQVVAFYTDGDNLDPADNNLTWDVFVRDRARQITRLISVNNAGQVGDGNSFLPAINEQGNYVTFGSSAKNLVAEDTNASWDIFLRIITPMNMPPIANAGTDQQASVGSVVQLDASQSYDPDATAAGAGPVSTYQWQVVSAPVGSSATINDVSLAMPTFVPDMDGVYVIGVVVNDGEFDSVRSTMTLTVTANKAPIAHIAINTSSGPPPLTVQVDALASRDPEGDSMTYLWEFSDPQSATNTSTLMSTSHSYQTAGSYAIILTVSDSFGNQSQAFTTVEVLAVNRAPEILSMANVHAGPAPLTVQFKANASDPDGDPLSYAWNFADASNDVHSVLADPVHTFTAAGTYIVSLDVSDGTLVTTQQLTIIVENPLEINVDEAVIEYEHDNIVNGKISFEATLSMNGQQLNLGADAVVTVQIDDMLLLNVPLSEFAVEKDEAGNDEYVYRDNYLKVEIEPAENEFEIHAARLLIGSQVDNANGVDFIVEIGDLSAIANVIMTTLPTVDCNNSTLPDSNDDYCVVNNAGHQILVYRSPPMSPPMSP